MSRHHTDTGDGLCAVPRNPHSVTREGVYCVQNDTATSHIHTKSTTDRVRSAVLFHCLFLVLFGEGGEEHTVLTLFGEAVFQLVGNGVHLSFPFPPADKGRHGI